VEDEFTTHEFRGTSEGTNVNHFDSAVVSIQSEDETQIDALIESQESVINCTLITKEEFKEMVSDSAQLNRIRDVVKEKIAVKYSFADEIAMLKKEQTDPKRVEYDIYVEECKLLGETLKNLIGY
jgi:hypothetical protein